MSASSAKVNDESWHTYRFANALLPSRRWDKAFSVNKKDVVEFMCDGCRKMKDVRQQHTSGKCINCTYSN